MIEMQEYPADFKKNYLEKVESVISEDIRSRIIKSCENYIPVEFWEGKPSFKALIMAPFSKIKCAKEYINNKKNNIETIMKTECFCKNAQNKHGLKSEYEEIYNAYYKIANSQEQNESMRVRIVRESGFTVCPYCNRDYINSRGGKASGAQLDHFYSRSKYPIFSVSLYNLVPVCGNCNRIKSSKNLDFASPFDLDIDWENDISFSYDLEKIDIEKIVIHANNKFIINNVEAMKLKEAYQIHTKEVRELVDKATVYNKSQIAEIRRVLQKAGLTEDEIKKAIFGNEITRKEMRTKPLGKMLHDLQHLLKIY